MKNSITKGTVSKKGLFGIKAQKKPNVTGKKKKKKAGNKAGLELSKGIS